MNKFKTHFHTLVEHNKRRIYNEENKIRPIYYTVQLEIQAPSLEEIKGILKTLKNNKVPREDNINSELIKLRNNIQNTQNY